MREARISVVIPTYNRKERLFRVLEALEKQTVSPEEFEVVVVDDGSSDGTAQALKAATFPFGIIVHSQKNGGPAVARNAGIERARADLVLFLDDDVVPEAQLIEEHLKSHAAEAEPVVVLGTLSSLSHYRQPWVAWEQIQIEKQYTAMNRGDYAPTYRQFWTGNASVLRAHLLGAGLFDVSFLRGEDVELGRRLAARGLGFRFNPRAKGWHHAERSFDSWCHAHASYGRLEVEIFAQGDGPRVTEILGANFARLHPLVRVCVISAIRVPLLHDGFVRFSRVLLNVPRAEHAKKATAALCSVLANVLYWRASSEALGPQAFADVRRYRSPVRHPEQQLS